MNDIMNMVENKYSEVIVPWFYHDILNKDPPEEAFARKTKEKNGRTL